MMETDVCKFHTISLQGGLSPSLTLASYALECECAEEPQWATGVRVTPHGEQRPHNGRNLGPWTRRAELSSQSRAPSLNCYERTTKRLPCRSPCDSGSVTHTQTCLLMPHCPTLTWRHIQSIQILFSRVFWGAEYLRIMSREERLICKLLKDMYLY